MKQSKAIYVKDQTAHYPVKEPLTISMHEAKSSLSRLVKRASAGETIYIGAYGKPEAMIKAVDSREYRAKLRTQAFGCMRGKIKFYKGWDDPLPDDIIDSFYNSKGLEEFENK